MIDELKLSSLGKTWILDLDGTIVKHNGYLIDGFDSFLEGAEAFLKRIPTTDLIIFLTSRTEEQRELTEQFLKQHEIRYDYMILGAPFGERIVINDRKPSGLKTAHARNTRRNEFCKTDFMIDENL